MQQIYKEGEELKTDWPKKNSRPACRAYPAAFIYIRGAVHPYMEHASYIDEPRSIYIPNKPLIII